LLFNVPWLDSSGIFHTILEPPIEVKAPICFIVEADSLKVDSLLTVFSAVSIMDEASYQVFMQTHFSIGVDIE